MRHLFIFTAAAALLTACGDTASTGTLETVSTPAPRVQVSGETLAAPASFNSITNESERSAALFDEMFKVIGHPRCMNCHPREGSITQGDDMTPHQPMIVRGEDTFGAPAMECSTCHGSENVSYVGMEGSIPGHAPWHVAPLEMGWQGLSVREICEQLKDETRNGGRTLEDLHEHNAEDGLVGWGWNPGKGREAAPGTQAEFGALTQAWIDTGAVCPE